jgi:hypothetical protein
MGATRVRVDWRQLAGAVTVAVAAAAVLIAQAHPDFSGRWILETGESVSDVPTVLSVRQSLVRTGARGERLKAPSEGIAIDRGFEQATRSETYQIGVSGGVVSGLGKDGGPGGASRHDAVKWDGNELVFENGTYPADPRETGVWSERREVWTLAPDGRLRVVITTRSSAGAPRSVTLQYRRITHKRDLAGGIRERADKTSRPCADAGSICAARLAGT